MEYKLTKSLQLSPVHLPVCLVFILIHFIPPLIIYKAASALPKARSNLSGFGLGTRIAGDADKGPSKRSLDFGEEEGARKKLEKLPTLPMLGDTEGDAALANDAEEDDEDDGGMEAAGTEEEAAAAARAAAEKREERLQHESLAVQAAEDATEGPDKKVETNNDIEMSNTVPLHEDITLANQEEEEVDPLDAFMEEMGDPF